MPFFIPYHAVPVDCSRWSARGLRNLLIEAGFEEDSIRADQWGNRAMALRNLEQPWPPEARPEDDLTNDPEFPLVAWAMGQKPWRDAGARAADASGGGIWRKASPWVPAGVARRRGGC